MKFLARTPQLAEQQAIRYIEQHCAVRGYTPRHGLDVVQGAMPGIPVPAATSLQPRWPLVLPVAYGIDALTLRAVTRNVSEGGVFVQTPSPADSGADLMLQLTLKALRLPLHGVVVWIRPKLEPGRPPGMGVRLVTPPTAYVDYLRSLPPPDPEEGSGLES